MASELEALLGRTVHGHKLVALLGEGGMSVVFRAVSLTLEDQQRAFKIILPALARVPEFTERFKQEARLLHRLEHPAIVRFFDLTQVELDGTPLLVMILELLEGKTLRAWLEELSATDAARAALDDVLRLLADAADGVGFAHDKGVLHRDLKPENLFKTDAGPVKILDFGIARLSAELEGARKLTQAGVAPGTVLYLAPELAKNQDPSTASDVYALGIILFELLTRRHPLLAPGERADNAPAILLKHVNDKPARLEALRPDAPKALCDLVDRCLAKDPLQRPQSGKALARELRAILEQRARLPAGHPTGMLKTDLRLPGYDEIAGATTTGAHVLPPAPDAPGSTTPSRRLPLALGAVAALALGGGLVARLLWPPSTPSPAPGEARAGGEPRAIATPDAGASGSLAGPPQLDPAPENAWVRLDPPPAGVPWRLGLSSNIPSADLAGFRPRDNVLAPADAFEMQQHEVTWGELDPWLAQHASAVVYRPAWVPAEARERRLLPASGVPYQTAYNYCLSLHASLPTEPQWEYAARGPERRGTPWGAEMLDPVRSNVFQGDDARPRPVDQPDQDQTPGPGPRLAGLLGNVQEWTLDTPRATQPPFPGLRGPGPHRVLRGFPLGGPTLIFSPEESAVYHEALCAAASCASEALQARLALVGFRCVRPVAAP